MVDTVWHHVEQTTWGIQSQCTWFWDMHVQSASEEAGHFSAWSRQNLLPKQASEHSGCQSYSEWLDLLVDSGVLTNLVAQFIPSPHPWVCRINGYLGLGQGEPARCKLPCIVQLKGLLKVNSVTIYIFTIVGLMWLETTMFHSKVYVGSKGTVGCLVSISHSYVWQVSHH